MADNELILTNHSLDIWSSFRNPVNFLYLLVIVSQLNPGQVGFYRVQQYVQASTGEENNNKYKNFYFKQVITLEGWSDIMYFVQDSHSFWNWIYFVVLIVVS